MSAGWQRWWKSGAAALRMLHLEAEVERLKQARVDTDRALEAGNVLGAISTEALRAEMERRRPREFVAEQVSAEFAGPAWWRREYVGQFVTGENCRVPRCLDPVSVSGRATENSYCRRHHELNVVEHRLEQLLRVMGPQGQIDMLRDHRDRVLSRFAELEAENDWEWRRFNGAVPRRGFPNGPCRICGDPSGHYGAAHSDAVRRPPGPPRRP